MYDKLRISTWLNKETGFYVSHYIFCKYLCISHALKLE